MDTVCVETISADEQIRRFVFDFLPVDPIYYRSGYQKEKLLRFLKKLIITEEEKATLRHVILRRVRNGALREFRRFCQFIPEIQNDAFIAELRAGAASTDAQIQRRAAFALEYVVR